MQLRQTRASYDLATLRGDVFGGITTAVVGLPVALAFGVASGLGAMAGLYGAIALGFFAAVFGGTRSQISGPTGPMAVAMAVVITDHASTLAEALTVVVMAGIIQALLGVLRFGRFVSYTPYSVISGFMSGVGIIIIILQTLPALGAASADGGPLEVMRAWPDAIAGINASAVAIAAVSLSVCIFWPARFSRWFPATLAALAAGTLLGVLWLADAPVIGEVPTGLPEFTAPALSLGALAGAVQPAVMLALLGAVDSLLTSLIADSMTRTRHNPNQELIGQGLGNIATGLVGGLPGAGATVGTVVNIRAGGSTRVSGALRALVLLTLVLGAGSYVESIPLAALAGILLKVGWDIVDWRFLKRLRRVQREHLMIMGITMVLTVVLDLITAVAIGLIVAAMSAARQFERLQLDNVVSVPLLDQSFLGDDAEGADGSDGGVDFSARVGLVALRGTFTVASSKSLIDILGADIAEHEVVIIDFADTVHMDDSAALVVERLLDTAEASGTEVILLGLDGAPATSLHALDVLGQVPHDRIVATLDEARALARRLLGLPESA
ncbi:SulP family inorganic anion transporter [Candidatus Poriferisodalis sp.]|uniref:SulP family inorganic anion transporter n=1 Tax=Candidatus Poriferisodalis sp. TaxID=3101277 RepID=UPI003B597FE2